jgi:hypothetical protein
MFHGTVAIRYTMDWDRSDVFEDRRILTERLTESFTDFGENIKQSFSDHALASIDYAVIVSNIYKVTDDQCQNERMMGVPIHAMWLQRHGYIERRGRNQLRFVMYSKHL